MQSDMDSGLDTAKLFCLEDGRGIQNGVSSDSLDDLPHLSQRSLQSAMKCGECALIYDNNLLSLDGKLLGGIRYSGVHSSTIGQTAAYGGPPRIQGIARVPLDVQDSQKYEDLSLFPQKKFPPPHLRSRTHRPTKKDRPIPQIWIIAPL